MQKHMDPRDLRRATNAKMFNVMAGAFLLLDAISHVLLYAMSYFNYVKEMTNGNEEFITQASEMGVTAGNLKTIASILLILAIVQILVGFMTLRFNNRLDKGNVLFKAAIGQLIFQIIAHTIIFLNRLPMLEIMLIGVMLSGCLIWSSINFLKLAQKYPERIWVVETEDKNKPGNRKKTSASKQSSTQVQKKGIMDRAKSVNNKEDL